MEATVKTSGQVVGFVDIGTNAVRLLVVRINPNFSYTVISQEKEVIRLGEGRIQRQPAQTRSHGSRHFCLRKIR